MEGVLPQSVAAPSHGKEQSPTNGPNSNPKQVIFEPSSSSHESKTEIQHPVPPHQQPQTPKLIGSPTLISEEVKLFLMDVKVFR